MKTEPTEADKLRNSIQYHLGVMDAGSGQFQEISCKIDELFELSYKEGQSNPKIKKLEWLKQTNGLIFTPQVFGITYCIYEDKEQWWIECQFYNDYECISIDCRDTLEEAKAAAQADFEKRVKECLE